MWGTKLLILHYRLQNLPFTITTLPILKAIWLSENQSKPLPNFSTDYVFNEPVLTCYLLPQIAGDGGYSGKNFC